MLSPLRLEAQERPPISVDQLERLLNSGVFSDERIITLAEQACLDFNLDEAIEARLQRAGATPSLIRQLRGVCTKVQLDVTTLIVMPQQLELAAGDTASLSARALADSVVTADVELSWSSANTAVATVDTSGIVTAAAPGTTKIFARTATGVASFATITVTATTDQIAQQPGGKSVGAAAALGVIIPGGGEFYTGNAAKGAVVLLGAAGALAAGYLITTTDSALSNATATAPPTCDPANGSCSVPIRVTLTETEERAVIAGAIVAGAFWIYGLIDGIRSAKRSGVRAESDIMEDQPVRNDRDMSFRIEFAPRDGFIYRANGDMDITIIRIKS